eukprot:c15977_g1_i1 orf=407-2245(+)
MGTEKDHRQSHAAAEVAMSSRSSRRPKNAVATGTDQLSSARHDQLTQSLSGQSLTEEKADPTAAPTELDVAPQSTRSKASLMKKLSFLLHPKKSKSKSVGSAQKPLSPSTHASAAGPGRELELLFAQAEATLGELLVRAGASFDARSSSSHADHPSQERGKNNGSDAVALIGSSSGRSAGLLTQGHVRRKSLSRVWQQLGGSLFCGSGHMSGYVMEEMPLPAHTSTCSGNPGVYEDVVLDEAYWQSLADAMLMQRHQQHQDAKLADHEAKLPADNSHHLEHEDMSRLAKEVQVERCDVNLGSKSSAHDLSVIGTRQQQPERLDSGGISEPLHVSDLEEADRESEIVPSIDVGSMCKWAVCGSTSSAGRNSLDMDSMYYRNFVGVEGGGSTRLNTTLEDSPNLAHNYQLHMKMDGAVMSSSTSVVELLNYYSFPAPVAEAAPPRSGQVETPPSMQPLERFLWQARGAGTAISSAEAMSATSPSSRSAPELTTCQEPAAVELSATTTASCRVSLMTLLHEEAAAIDSPTTSSAFEARQEEEEEAVAEEGGGLQGRRRLVGEDPLLCCVCMVRRKGAALIPCGHTFCRICSKQLFAGRGACPLCNNLIVQVLDIF